MHKGVHSMVTYPLRVNQFTTQQVGKGGKGKELSLMAQNPTMNMHKHVHYRELTGYQCARSQHSQWVKEVKEGKNLTQHTKSNIDHVQRLFPQRQLTR